jgi:hypothetical protein
MRSFYSMRILSIPLLTAGLILWATSSQAGDCTTDPKLSPDGFFAAAKLVHEKAEKAKSDAEAEVFRLKALIKALPGRIKYVVQLAQQASDGNDDETFNLERLKKDLENARGLKDRIDPRLDHLITTLKGLVFHQLHVEDAWLRTTLRTDIHNYSDMKMLIDGQFAGDKIHLAMDWDFKKSESNFIRLGEALLAGSYSFQGASDIDLGFMTPDPQVRFSCSVNNGRMLSVKDQKSKEGQPVVFWPAQAGSDGQDWFYKDNTLVTKLSTRGAIFGEQQWEDNDHLVVSVDPNASKDEDGNIKSGAALVLKPRSGDPLQRWKKVKHDGGVRLENRGTNLVVGCGKDKKTGDQLQVQNKDEDGAKAGWKVTEIHLKKEENTSQD